MDSTDELKNLWQTNDDANSYFGEIKTDLLIKANKKSNYIMNKLKRNITINNIIELAISPFLFMFFLEIFNFEEISLTKKVVVVTVMTAFMLFIFVKKLIFYKNLKVIDSIDNVKKSLQSKIIILRKYINNNKRLVNIGLVLTFALIAYTEPLLGEEWELAKSMFLIIGLLIMLGIINIFYVFIKNILYYNLNEKHIEHLEEILRGLDDEDKPETNLHDK